MEKWLKKLELFLIVVGGVLYIGAKIHFFTRYGVLGDGAYLEEHWPFWAGMLAGGAVLAVVGWIRKRLQPPRSSRDTD